MITRRRRFVFGENEILIECRGTPDDDSCDESGKEFSDSVALQNSVDQVGLDIWESATDLICRYILANAHLVRDRQVIELGAGVGVVSMLAAKLGARTVVCTDYDPVVLSLASHNSELNQVKHRCVFEQYDWDSTELPFSLSGDGSSTLLLGSDLMYSTACATKLRKAIELVLSKQPSAIMLLSHEIRHSVTWGLDSDGRKEPVVESFDSVLESFLACCKPIPVQLTMRDFRDESSGARRKSSGADLCGPSDLTHGTLEHTGVTLYGCVLPCSNKGLNSDLANAEAEDSREMCSAAEVEEMTLQLMRKAMIDGVLRPEESEVNLKPSPPPLLDKPSPSATAKNCVHVDTSRSGEAILMAFSFESSRLVELRDAFVPLQ
jgi:hypothetical protein